MKSHYHSTNNSQYQSITSKSSNSSITSILREPSPDRPKKKNTVRFDDSPSVSIYSDAVKFDQEISSPLSQFSHKSSSPPYYKPLSPSPTRKQEQNEFSPVKKMPIKALSTPEPKQEEEKKVTPKVINYSFRSKDFYQKLNKFYTSESPPPPKEPERIYIKLDPKSFIEKTNPDNQVIHLRPCSSKPYARSKDNRTQAIKRNRGQNILN